MRDNIIKSLRNRENEMISSIQEIVRIDSVLDEKSATKEKPFGEGVDLAIRKALEIAERLGFRTFYGDGYYGYAETVEGEEMIGILGHVDVVPVGDESIWKFPPFAAEISDGKIYGRGTQDDKGPVITAMYAVKALLDAGVSFNKRIRFIFGGDEENQWRCISKYNENNEEIPSMSFTPDSSFPATNAEKGLIQFYINGKGSDKTELSNTGALNAVPGKAVYKGSNFNNIIKALENTVYKYEIKNHSEDYGELYVYGKRVHSANADEGINAIEGLCKILLESGIDEPVIKFAAEVSDSVGSKIIPDCRDDVSGTLTLNLAEIVISRDKSYLGFDSRVPVTYEMKDFKNAVVEKANNYGLEYEEVDCVNSLYIPKDSPLVSTLASIYEEETELSGSPISSGGATYARAIDNCVAFGALFPYDEMTEHQENERAEIKNIIKASEIYALSVYKLLNM